MSGTPSSADVVVVGGGIVGCFTAYYAARAGLRVVLFERDGIAAGTSGCCMGHLMVVPGPGALHRLTLASVRLWRQLATDLGTFHHDPAGALWLAEREDDLDLVADLAQQFAAHGCPGTLLDAKALREREPGVAADLAGAFYFPEDAIVMPMMAAGAVLRAAVELGATVRPHTPVRGLRQDAGGAIEAVITDGGAVATPAVVNAAGVWAPWVAELVGLSGLPVYPRRGDLAITMPRECPVRHQLLEVSYLRTTGNAAVEPTSGEPDPGAYALNVQPQTHGTCLIGSTRQFGGLDRAVNRGLLERSLRGATRFVPALAGARLTRAWSGLRPYTSDKLPILGEVAEVPGFHMATGHEGLGITLAPISAQLVVQAMRGEVPALLEPFLPGRFGLAEARDG